MSLFSQSLICISENSVQYLASACPLADPVFEGLHVPSPSARHVVQNTLIIPTSILPLGPHRILRTTDAVEDPQNTQNGEKQSSKPHIDTERSLASFKDRKIRFPL